MKLSKAERRAIHKASQRRQDTKDRFIYAIPIIGAALFLLAGWLKPMTVGYDVQYNFCVIVLPIIIGLVGFLIFRNKVLDVKAVNATRGIRKVVYGVILLIAVSLFSFFTFGTAAIIIFETVNYEIAKKSVPNTLVIPIERYFNNSKHQGVNFNFEGHSESISLNSQDVEKYESQRYKHIKLTIRKGIWNHYIVDEYEIIR